MRRTVPDMKTLSFISVPLLKSDYAKLFHKNSLQPFVTKYVGIVNNIENSKFHPEIR